MGWIKRFSDGREQKKQQKELNQRFVDAAKDGNIDGLKRALADGAQIDARDKNQDTALSNASIRYHDNPDILIFLLEAGADVDAGSSLKSTPLHFTGAHNNMGFTKVLLAAGAKVDSKDHIGKTPADWAWKSGSKETGQYLQDIAFGKEKLPTPEEVGLDMNKRNESLRKLGKPVTIVAKKPVLGSKTGAVVDAREVQRKAALEDPSQGI